MTVFEKKCVSRVLETLSFSLRGGQKFSSGLRGKKNDRLGFSSWSFPKKNAFLEFLSDVRGEKTVFSDFRAVCFPFAH